MPQIISHNQGLSALITRSAACKRLLSAEALQASCVSHQAEDQPSRRAVDYLLIQSGSCKHLRDLVCSISCVCCRPCRVNVS